jgi:hypothetical protein
MWSWIRVLSVILCLICGLTTSSGQAKSCSIFNVQNVSKSHVTKHKLQLQLFDANGSPIPNTQFWVTADILQIGSEVTLQLPLINFQVIDPAMTMAGGYLDTVKGFLPKQFRPKEIISRTAASDNGMSLPFTFTIPTPPSGYALMVTEKGALQVRGIGGKDHLIPVGPQVLLPAHLIYKVRSKESKRRVKPISHTFQLQLYNCNGVPVPDSHFPVTLTIIKDGARVTIQLPSIDFITSGSAAVSCDAPLIFPGSGYLSTSEGFLPEELRPTDQVHRSILVSNGSTGYILSVTQAGGLVIQGAGEAGNLIGPGTHTLPSADLSYILQPRIKLRHNRQISREATTVTQLIDPFDPLTASVAAVDGVSLFAWADNSNNKDKVINSTDLMVAVGRVHKKRGLELTVPLQLSHLTINQQIVETAASINLTDNMNMVVSYGVVDRTVSPPTAISYRAVSFDGGKTWPVNGPVTLAGLADQKFTYYPGVASDKYGNIWLMKQTETEMAVAVSTDGGVNFKPVFSLPVEPSQSYRDPKCCFGADGLGHYGLYYAATAEDINLNSFPVVGFIPINGLDSFGTPAETLLLSEFANNLTHPVPTASNEGHLWLFGKSGSFGGGFSLYSTLYKSLDPHEPSYAGPWNFATVNQLDAKRRNWLESHTALYDNRLKALYRCVQNGRITFAISRDNGQTSSHPIVINNSNVGNRGLQSMALDPIRGDLYFGWYDGRNDPSFTSLHYYGAVIPAQVLKKMTKAIPLSNPQYTLPAAD